MLRSPPYSNRRTRTLQPTCYPYDCSTVNEDGESLDRSSRHCVARTRLNSAFCLKDSLGQTYCSAKHCSDERILLGMKVARSQTSFGQILLGRILRGREVRGQKCSVEIIARSNGARSTLLGRTQDPKTGRTRPLKPTCYWCDCSTAREDGTMIGGFQVPRSGPHAA